MLVMVWTEGLRQYHWSDISIIDYAGFQVLTVAPGLGFWLHAAYSYVLLLLDSLLLVRQYLHSPPAYRRQIGAMFARPYCTSCQCTLYLSAQPLSASIPDPGRTRSVGRAYGATGCWC